MREHENEFKCGDRVLVKHGAGPTMVVEEVYLPFYYYRYRCCWTGDDGVIRREIFRGDDLKADTVADK